VEWEVKPLDEKVVWRKSMEEKKERHFEQTLKSMKSWQG